MLTLKTNYKPLNMRGLRIFLSLENTKHERKTTSTNG